MNKRDFLKASVAAGVTAALVHPATALSADTPGALQNMTGNAVPISVAERKARVAKAQQLMQAAGIDALVIEAGSALVYFTGVRWWRSERFTGVVIPAEGEFAIITPYFEEPSIRESMAFGDDVRTWNRSHLERTR
jgi:Xaa-Pro dipeptidase